MNTSDLQARLADIGQAHRAELRSLTGRANEAAASLYAHASTDLRALAVSLTRLVERVRADARDLAAVHVMAELREVAGAKAAGLSVPMGADPEPSEVAQYIDNAVQAAREADDPASTLYRAQTVVESEAATQYQRARHTAHTWLRDMGDAKARQYGFAIARTEAQFRTAVTETRDDSDKVFIPLIGERWNARADACERCKGVDGQLRPFGFAFSEPGPTVHARCQCVRTLWAVGWQVDTQRAGRRKRRGAEMGEQARAPDATLLRAYTPEAERSTGVDRIARTVDVVASTESWDSHGTKLLAAGWDLDRYTRNPVLLSCHNSHDLRAVIGTCTVEVKGKKLLARMQFLPEGLNDEADLAFALYESGALKGVSVGFAPRDWKEVEEDGRTGRVYTRQELVEVSAVPVPSNADALARALREFGAAQPQKENHMSDQSVAAAVDTDSQAKVAELELRLDAAEKARDAAIARAEAAEQVLAEQVTRQRESEVDGLVKAGRIPEGKRAAALTLLASNEAAFREIYPPVAAEPPMAHLLRQVVPAARPEASRPDKPAEKFSAVLARVQKANPSMSREEAHTAALAEMSKDTGRVV